MDSKNTPLQLKFQDAKYECDMMAQRKLTNITEAQLIRSPPNAKKLPYTFQVGGTDYV